MNAKFTEIHEAADYLGPGAIEVPLYQSEIANLVRRRGILSQRIKQVPATGHPSRFFEEWQKGLPRVELSVPLKALVARIKYNLFDMELGKQQSQFAYLQGRDLNDAVDNVLRSHDLALWHGKDTSLTTPTTSEYFGAATQIAWGTAPYHVPASQLIVDGLKRAVAEMVAQHNRPTAIYANPVLLDLVDREMKSEFGSILPTQDILDDLPVKVLPTDAGALPLIPDWALPYTGLPGSGGATFPAYIVTEDLIEYHWLGDTHPRVFHLQSPGSLSSEYVVVKFGGLVVKNARTAHRQVLVTR